MKKEKHISLIKRRARINTGQIDLGSKFIIPVVYWIILQDIKY